MASFIGNLIKRAKSLNLWRDSFNPLRGLTIKRCVAMLEAYALGEFVDLMWTYGHPTLGIETIDADLSALITRREAAIKKLDWNIKTVKPETTGFDKAKAEKQAGRLRAEYEAIDNLSDAIGFLCLATFRGFAMLERQKNEDGSLHLEPVDHWNLVRDGYRGAWKYNPDARSATFAGLGGDPLPKENFILREVKRPVNPIALVKYARGNVAEKDWDGFVEIYGIPGGVVIMPPNVPSEKEKEYEDAASKVSEGGSGALPHGSEYKPNSEPRGQNPFRDRLEYLTEKLILAGTGGKLTMLSSPTGIGSGPSDQHEDVFDEIAKAEAVDISTVFQRCIDARILAAEFPGEPVLAYFALAQNEETDTSAFVQDVNTLSQAGYQVSPQQITEKTGYEVELKAPVAPTAPGKAPVDGPTIKPKQEDTLYVKNRRKSADDPALGEFLAQARASMATAESEDLLPFIEAVRGVIAADDTDIAQKLGALRVKLPEILKQISTSPRSAEELKKIVGTAMASGIAEEAAKVAKE